MQQSSPHCRHRLAALCHAVASRQYCQQSTAMCLCRPCMARPRGDQCEPLAKWTDSSGRSQSSQPSASAADGWMAGVITLSSGARVVRRLCREGAGSFSKCAAHENVR